MLLIAQLTDERMQYIAMLESLNCLHFHGGQHISDVVVIPKATMDYTEVVEF